MQGPEGGQWFSFTGASADFCICDLCGEAEEIALGVIMCVSVLRFFKSGLGCGESVNPHLISRQRRKKQATRGSFLLETCSVS